MMMMMMCVRVCFQILTKKKGAINLVYIFTYKHTYIHDKLKENPFYYKMIDTMPRVDTFCTQHTGVCVPFGIKKTKITCETVPVFAAVISPCTQSASEIPRFSCFVCHTAHIKFIHKLLHTK